MQTYRGWRQPRGVGTRTETRHMGGAGEKHGEKGTKKELNGKTGPQHRERDRNSLRNYPSPVRACTPHPAPAPCQPPVPKLSVTINEL